MRGPTLFLALWLLATPAWALPEDAPAAMITDVSGRAQVLRGTDWKPASMLDELARSSRIRVQSGGRVTMTLYPSAVRVSLKGPVTAVLEENGPRVVEGATSSSEQLGRRTSAVGARARPVGVTMGAEILRAAPEPFHILTRGAQLKAPAMLSWTADTRAVAYYRVIVKDGDGTVFFDERVVGATRLQAPSLTEDVDYQLQVTSYDERSYPLVVESTFSIMSQARHDKLEEVSRALREEFRKYPDDPSPLLALATQYHGAGLDREALLLTQQVARQRPGDVGVQRFLATLYFALGREGEGQKASEKARALREADQG